MRRRPNSLHPRELYKSHMPGCACHKSTPGLSGVLDDLKAAAIKATAPAQEKLDNFELAIKAILVFSAIAAVTGILTNVRKR